ncbi:hypothetical protein K1T71_015041 [Dendrolimus kikuchii]|nr:hypothetical protein K1T71_015041 [Dendrolimus kikuchii]
MSAPCKELVTLLSEYAMVCRGCLAASGEMKNMFECGLHKEFAKYTDVQIRRDDGISELICSVCEESLVICKNFRSQCQQSDLLLRNSLMMFRKNSLKNPYKV